MKLWYLSQLLPLRDARRPAASASSGRSARRRSGRADPAVDAELILLLGGAAGGDRRARREARARHASASRTSRAAYREELKAYLRANEDQLVRGGRRPDRPQPAARVRRQARAHAARDGQGAAADRPPARRRTSTTSPRSRTCCRPPDLSYTVDTTLVRGLDYYTRTLFEFQSGALEAAQNTLGGGGRYDGLAEVIGGPATPGMGWAAGVERMLMASTQPQPVEAPVDLFVAYEPEHKVAAFKLASRRAPGRPLDKTRTRRAQPEGPAQAGFAHPSSLRCHLRRRRRPASRPRRWRGQARRARNRHAPHPGNALRPPRANLYRDAWAGELDAARVVRTCAWPGGSTAGATTAA